jgi:uncharacterized protein
LKLSIFILLFSLTYPVAALDTLIIPIADFVSLTPSSQDPSIHIPPGYSFQTLATFGDAMADGNTFLSKFDFTGYVPINGSSENGYLSINHEAAPGGVSMMDMSFNTNTKRWLRSNEKAVDFSSVFYTASNCSGTVTPWNTIITCEEYAVTTDINNDGYYDNGWAIEIDPASKAILHGDKLRALGNFRHENIVIHSNERTAYQGADSPIGYLYKFVANNPQDLTAGNLYVFKATGATTGEWLVLNNSTQTAQNTVNNQAAALNATPFNGIEDVEINPISGQIYFAAKGNGAIYRFTDSNPLTGGTTVSNFEMIVGDYNKIYTLTTDQGVINEPWGIGNDNLAFDNEGNLWVLQDGNLSSPNGDKNFLWVIGKNHTQANPDVKIFMKTPKGSEPTGITFSPDNRFLFMSIQHPNYLNGSTLQADVNDLLTAFDKETAIVIARNEHWGIMPCVSSLTHPNQTFESATYKSESTINSSAQFLSGTKSTYTAAQSISLNPGFLASQGSTFMTKVEGCVD